MLRIVVEKFQSDLGEYWTNVYHISGSNPAGASSIGAAIAAAERPLYGPHVTLVKYRIDDTIEGTDNYLTVALNQAGTRSAANAASSAPLFAIARVDFNVGAGGRPCRKFMRCLQDADSVGPTITSAMITLLNTYASAVVNQIITDPQGNAVTSHAVHPLIGMRQLRKGSKKKVIP